MFWKRNNNDSGENKLPGPKNIPDFIGRYIVINDNLDPELVWRLKVVLRPVGKKEFYYRAFDQSQTNRANINVKDWTSLDEHPEFVLWEGYFNKGTEEVRKETFKKTP